MKNYFLFQNILLGFVFLCCFCFSNQLEAQRDTLKSLYFPSGQYLTGAGNGQRLHHVSADSSVTGFVLWDRELNKHGFVFGKGHGDFFGLLDKNGNWFLENRLDKYIAFRISGTELMRLGKKEDFGTDLVNSDYVLGMRGTILAEEILVEDKWPDYVFEEGYIAPSLEEEKIHIIEQGHLIGFKSSEEMAGKIPIGDTARRQQEKIEELMLHTIDLNEKMKNLEANNKELRQLVEQLIQAQSKK